MCKEGKMCISGVIAKILVIVGGINWGLVGIGFFLNTNLNLVNLLLGSMPILEVVVYLLVGISAIMMIFSCKCCGNSCKVESPSTEQPAA